MSDVLDFIWDELHRQLDDVRRKSQRGLLVSEQAGYADGIPATTFANLPTNGLADGAHFITLAWVTDGRKSAEGAGAGTGVLAIYDANSATWLRVGEDYAPVTI